MRKFYRTLLLGTVILVLLTTACAEAPDQGTALPTLDDTDLTDLPPLGGTSTAGTDTAGTGTPDVAGTATTGTPPAAGTPVGGTTSTAGTPVAGATGTAAIPVTGENVTVLCEFCMNGVPHAVVAVPENTTFASTVSDANADADLTCYSVETTAGSQLVICYGSVSASFNLSVCTTDDNCADFPVTLMDCPDATPGGATTPGAGTGTGTAPAATATGAATATPTVPVLITPTNTP